MRLVDANRELLRHVAVNMRDRDYEEFSAASWARSREELADALASVYGGREDVWVACSDDGVPVAVGGVIQLRPNVITLLFYSTPRMSDVFMYVTRLFKTKLLPAMEQAGAHRVECITLETNESAHRWLRLLGLKKEAEHKFFGREGQTYLTYSKVKDANTISS